MAAFDHLSETHYITWVFIPAGVRLVAALLMDGAAIFGLFIGAMITNAIFNEISLSTSIMVSLISAINPYIAIQLSKYMLKVNDMLSHLKAKQLVTMSVISALFNTLSHNAYFYSHHLHKNILTDVLSMFVGDVLGCLILLYTLSLTIKWMRHTVQTNK
jgi:hypothetical protein